MHDKDPQTPPLSQRFRRMPRSSIRRLFNAARELEREGRTVVRLDIGDPDLELPDRVADGVRQAFLDGKTHYSSMSGILPLRNAVARHLKRRLDVDCEARHTTLTQGATQALNSVLQLICDPGDAYLMPEVYWPNCTQQTTLAGVHPRFYPLDSRFQPVLERLDSLWDPAVRAILINSPSNPTGAVFPPETVRSLYEFAVRRDLWIVSDEAYTDYVYDGPHLSPLQIDWEPERRRRRVLGVFSFSKSFAATGLRMGWVVAPDPGTARSLALMNEPLTGSLTTPLQWGLVRAFEEDDSDQRRETLRRRRDLATNLLRDAGLEVEAPRGGLFFFLDVSASGLNGDGFADRLLAEEGVAVVPGSGFGLRPEEASGGIEFRPGARADRCVRICFAVPEARLREGIPKIARFLR